MLKAPLSFTYAIFQTHITPRSLFMAVWICLRSCHRSILMDRLSFRRADGGGLTQSLSSFHVDKLAAMSRWVLVKIVYGVEINVDELSKADASCIVTEEICEYADPVESEPPTLVQSKQYPKRKNEMIQHFETLQTKDKLRHSYVICPPERPTEFDSLLHELEYGYQLMDPLW